jgi:plasmid replication initiation protein
MNNHNCKPNHHSIVAKDNSMIEKLAKFKLSELRLIAYCLAHYDSTESQNRTFTARIFDLQELFPINKKSAYRVVETAMLGINEKPLKFKEGNKKYFWNWFSGFAYEESTGEFEFSITPEIRPYLLGLKNTFTKYRLKSVYQFKSAHTWKLYENLKKQVFKHQWFVGLEELKTFLGVPDKYKKTYEFDRRVIKPAVNEINNLSDLVVSYEKQKRGRSIVGILFIINEKQPENVIDIESPRQTFARLLTMEGINEKTILEYVKMAENRGKMGRCIEQFPRIVGRWDKGKGLKRRYLLGSLKNEINQQTLFSGQNEKPATGQVDFSIYSNEDLDVFERVPGYEDDIQTEKKRRKIF